MPVKAKEKGEWEELPKWVILNPRAAAMFNDSELSGLYLTQWEGTDSAGNEIKNWGHVPKDNDCSRIKVALNANILFPSNPKGECRHIPPPIVRKGSMDELMSMHMRELIQVVDQITDAKLLTDMREWEMDRPQKERRVQLLQAISGRLNSYHPDGLRLKFLNAP